MYLTVTPGTETITLSQYGMRRAGRKDCCFIPTVLVKTTHYIDH